MATMSTGQWHASNRAPLVNDCSAPRWKQCDLILARDFLTTSKSELASTGTLPLFLSEAGRDKRKSAEILQENNNVQTNQRSVHDSLRLQPIIAWSLRVRHTKLLVRCELPPRNWLMASLHYCCAVSRRQNSGICNKGVKDSAAHSSWFDYSQVKGVQSMRREG